MIIQQLLNTSPIVFGSGLATKVKGESLPEPIEQAVNEFCYCEFECEYIGKVFADKSKTLKATVKALFNEVTLREKMNLHLLNY